MTFGEKIRELRKINKITQRELAEKVGVSFTYISKIENERLEHTPSIKTIRSLAQALEADELELMEHANKIPSIFGPMTDNEYARQFFQRVSKSIKGPEGWQDLLDYLDKRA